ncbi:hypothetical protein JCGZ_24785 [Jatropha curcas]|uniref:Helicase C-terminal domain-containing protein n=1 Tax=Jatropha curcas TaxID=180498 RepID=A0A067KX70_JATCU|nr:hypothetical protein JCGZ_24785 [Jatropha curcas]
MQGALPSSSPIASDTRIAYVNVALATSFFWAWVARASSGSVFLCCDLLHGARAGLRILFHGYVHWIGRTGRAGAKGTAYTFFTASNARFAKELITILEEAGQKVSPELTAMGRGAPPPPGYGSFRERGRGYGGGRSWS